MNDPIVSVLTPSIPGRHVYLSECRRSVSSQSFRQFEHLVEIDHEREGCAKVMNRLADQSRATWLLPLADDDLLLPGCIEMLMLHSKDADVVYAPPLVTGNEDRWWFFQAPPVIPSCALIRNSLWMRLGGYNESLVREEDRDLWTRALAEDARFVRVDEPCWVYRQHAGQKSFNQAVAA